MKHAVMILAVAGLAACSSSIQHKTPAFLGLVGPMEWPEEHWEGQNFHPLIRDRQFLLPAASQSEDALFHGVDDITPSEFIERLRKADIIERVYGEQTGGLKPQDTGKTVVVLDHNFYSLSSTDQNLIAELIARSYRQDTYVLQDAMTGMYVGQITPEGLNLF